jgi:hypothetical protein
VKFTVTVAEPPLVLIAFGVKLKAVRFGAAELCANPVPGRAVRIKKASRVTRSTLIPVIITIPPNSRESLTDRPIPDRANLPAVSSGKGRAATGNV